MDSAKPRRDAAGLQTLEEFEREAQDLWNQGLRESDFLRALSGEGESLVVRTPEQLDAFFAGGDGRLQTVDEFHREIEERMKQGLRGDELVRALGGKCASSTCKRPRRPSR